MVFFFEFIIFSAAKLFLEKFIFVVKEISLNYYLRTNPTVTPIYDYLKFLRG